jgi:hypothetical protein
MARPQVADVRWVPCHHGMARPQVADGGDGLRIWRAAANILYKESRAADKGLSSSLRIGARANNSSLQLISLLRKMTRSLEPSYLRNIFVISSHLIPSVFEFPTKISYAFLISPVLLVCE